MAIDILAGLSMGLVASGGSCDYPNEGDVRYGVEYSNGSLVGTLGGVGGDGTEWSPADIIRYLLILMNQGTDPADNSEWPVFCSGEPDKPMNCITTYDTSDKDGGRLQFSGERLEKYGVQIRVRGEDHATAYAKKKALEDVLDQTVFQETVSLGGSTYLVWAIHRGLSTSLGKDTPVSKRNKFVINLFATIRKES